MKPQASEVPSAIDFAVFESISTGEESGSGCVAPGIGPITTLLPVLASSTAPWALRACTVALVPLISFKHAAKLPATLPVSELHKHKALLITIEGSDVYPVP